MSSFWHAAEDTMRNRSARRVPTDAWNLSATEKCGKTSPGFVMALEGQSKQAADPVMFFHVPGGHGEQATPRADALKPISHTQSSADSAAFS